MNLVILHGNVGKDFELKKTANDVPFVNLTIATNEYSNGEKKTEWHNVTLWQKNAENAAKYLTKGSSVIIEGKLQTRQWEDKDGNKRYTTEIIGFKMEFTGSRDDSKEARYAKTKTIPTKEEAMGMDEIPF